MRSSIGYNTGIVNNEVIIMSTRNEAVKKAMKELMNELNVLGGETDMAAGLTEALQGEHRTIQQSFFRVFAESMKEYANTGTDMRNAAAVEYAKEINKIDFHFPYI